MDTEYLAAIERRAKEETEAYLRLHHTPAERAAVAAATLRGIRNAMFEGYDAEGWPVQMTAEGNA